MEFYQVVGVNECDRAIDFLRTPVVLSIADVDLLHTRATQSLTYSDTCGEVDSAGSYSDCVGGLWDHSAWSRRIYCSIYSTWDLSDSSYGRSPQVDVYF